MVFTEIKYGCPPRFIAILCLLHDNMHVVVLSSGAITDSFEVKTGVKQGCVITPTLFFIFLAAMLHLTTETPSWHGANIPNGR